MTNRMNSYVFACYLVLAATPAAAAEIVGQIAAVSGKEIGVVVAGKLAPQPGDKFTVFVNVPGIGEARVGEGKVNSLDAGIVLGTVTAATGEVAVGQTVKINSPQAVAATPATASNSQSVPASGGELLGLKLDPVDGSIAELLDLPKAAGLIVRAVAPGSPAETAGLKKRDVLLRAGGAELNDLEAFRTAAGKLEGDLKVEIWRDGAAQTVALTLPAPATSMPAAAPSPAAAAAVPVWIGLAIETFRDDIRVNGVVPSSPGARAGFRSGDRLKTLDGEEAVDAAHFIRDIMGGALGKSRRIELSRGDERLTFELLPEPRPTNEQLFVRMKKLAEAGDHDAELHLASMYESGQGVPDRDAVAARRWMHAAAEGGVAYAQARYGLYLLNGRGGEKNSTEGVEWIKKGAEQQEPGAMVFLANAYKEGVDIEKDEAEARRWYGRALNQGSLEALMQMGRMYEFGELYEKDPAKAAECFRTAAHRGYVTGQTEWGRCLNDGIGVEQDSQAALRWLQAGSDAGDRRAHAILGDMYFNGQGVAQDRETGVKYFQKGAALGQETAMFNLGVAYSIGQGVPTDLGEAYRWFRAAADRNYVDAYLQLGLMYERGQGVTQSDEQAVAWYLKSAEAGIAAGQYDLAVMYTNGRGVERNDAEAMKWCLQAARQDHAEAEWLMGIIVLEGRGVQKDPATAYTWFKAGAGHGNARAQYYLGTLYESGSGVARNQSEASKWYERAAGQNDASAIDALKRLGLR